MPSVKRLTLTSSDPAISSPGTRNFLASDVHCRGSMMTQTKKPATVIRLQDLLDIAAANDRYRAPRGAFDEEEKTAPNIVPRELAAAGAAR
jgi:hypothetical protein